MAATHTQFPAPSRKRYLLGRLLANVVSLAGWIIFIFALIFLVASLPTLVPGGAMALGPGAAGLLMVLFAELAKAIFDIAER